VNDGDQEEGSNTMGLLSIRQGFGYDLSEEGPLLALPREDRASIE